MNIYLFIDEDNINDDDFIVLNSGIAIICLDYYHIDVNSIAYRLMSPIRSNPTYNKRISGKFFMRHNYYDIDVFKKEKHKLKYFKEIPPKFTTQSCSTWSSKISKL